MSVACHYYYRIQHDDTWISAGPWFLIPGTWRISWTNHYMTPTNGEDTALRVPKCQLIDCLSQFTIALCLDNACSPARKQIWLCGPSFLAIRLVAFHLSWLCKLLLLPQPVLNCILPTMSYNSAQYQYGASDHYISPQHLMNMPPTLPQQPTPQLESSSSVRISLTTITPHNAHVRFFCRTGVAYVLKKLVPLHLEKNTNSPMIPSPRRNLYSMGAIRRH